LDLLQTVHDWTEPELILEILKNAPAYWKTVINTTGMMELLQLQDALQLHEETLMRDPNSEINLSFQRVKDLERSRQQPNQ